VKCLFINTWPSWYKVIMIMPTVKFMLHGSLACKRAYDGGYLLGGKCQVYFTGKTSNLPLTYLPIMPFNPALLLVISFFLWWVGDPIDEPEARWRSSRRVSYNDVLGCPRRWMDGGKFLARFVARIGEELELLQASHDKFSWRRVALSWMTVALLRGYRADESMVDGLRCYGGIYLYRIGCE
jgi:hypothetical protein